MKQAVPAFAESGAFRDIFFEEAQEHLASTEAILLRLDTEAPSPDDLNAIFRAVHSIKGSAAMLGFQEIAALAHVFENLLDLLRKGERSLVKADVDAMLEAGDVAKAQVAHRRGQTGEAPDPAAAEAVLRERVAVAVAGVSGGAPRSRRFSVRLGPLAAVIDPPELEMMLTGLADMGTLANQSVENSVGGLVSFDVTLEGTETDLRSVLSLVVAPEQIAVQADDGVPAPSKAASVPAADPLPAVVPPGHADSELFVDPVEFKRNRQALIDAAAARQAASAAGPAPENRDERPVAAERSNAQRPAAPAASAATPEPGRATPNRQIAEAAEAVTSGASSLRVATAKIDLLVNLVGELVITESMLSRQGALFEERAGQHGLAGLADLARNTRDLQEAVLAIRMVPINDGFARIPRLVRELSARLGKRVELTVTGQETELDRGLIEKLADPLVHLVRNAVDHGLETPEERLAAGKSEVGTLTLSSRQRGGRVVIEVIDDGRGLDRERILAHAAERGRILPSDASDAEVWQLLFEAGFSTAEEITDLSGRGVGMDVVRRNILSLGGAVEIASRKGQGVTVTMTVPLTLAIMEAMTVSLGEQIYVLPLASVLESRSIAADDLHALPGQGETLAVRGSYLPVLRLRACFPPATPSAAPGDAIAVIVEADGSCAAVLVDALVGQQQVVVKSLETNFRRVPGVSAATIMSDGSVALILDVPYLVKACGATPATAARQLDQP